MEKTKVTVYKTDDLDLFETLQGNRKINLLHLNRLIESIKMKNLLHISPIVVNENMQVIDGQHRLHAAKDLGLEIYYVVDDSLGLEDVQLLNSNTKNWTTDDYMHAYCELGYEDYLIYRDFKNKYQVNHTTALLFLSGSNSRQTIAFKSGQFQVVDLEQAERWAEMLNDFKKKYDGFTRRSFVYAVLKMFRHEDYDHDRMVERMEVSNLPIRDAVNVREYLRQLEDIYNYDFKTNRIRFF